MKITHKALFDKLRDDTFINRCEQYAYYTLPYLMASQLQISSTGRAVVERDFQEIGALLSNNLAAKLVRLLFPTQYAFFKASASAEFKKHAKSKGFAEEKLNTMFAQLETNAKDRLFVNSGYASLILAMKYLLITGNVLLYRDSKAGKVTAWGPHCFSVKRDGAGEVLDIILKEFTTVEALPEDLRAALRASNSQRYNRDECEVEKYTRIHRTTRNGNAGFEITQEVDALPVGDHNIWYPIALCPWMCPTWTLIPGEHYGRGLVEDYAGGFAKLSSLSESAALYGVEMCRVFHLVGAGSGTDIDSMNQAESGDFVRGDPASVQAYEAGDAAKLQQLSGEIDRVFQRLSKAFMYSGQARQAERVTAFELQQEAAEAEHALGGAISTLSGGIQVPLAHILMSEVSNDALTGLITGDLKPDVTTGIPALGRSSDVQNLIQAAQEIAGILPIAQLDKRINSAKMVDMILAGRSIDPTQLFYTKEEQRANEEAQAAQNAAQSELIKAQTLGQQGEQIAGLSGA